MATASPGPSESPSVTEGAIAARTSSRARIKSQRQLESELTNRYFKSKIVPDASPEPVAVKREAKKSVKRKGKKDALYCICRSDGTEGRPMIECGECTDWFHFDCIGLSEDDAERIHLFVCGKCEEKTGEKTTHTYDVAILPSPSPPPGLAPPLTKRKHPKKLATKPQGNPASPVDEASSQSTDDSEDNHASSSGSSASGSFATSVNKKSAKRPRPSITASTRLAGPRTSVERKPSVNGSIKLAGPLPPARLHVQKKMTEVVTGLFSGNLNGEQARFYAEELEAGLWSGFKESVNGKDIPGGRYKTQFNLLSSSLPRARLDLRQSIIDHTLTPVQVANLTSADLASQERLQEIEKAKRAALEQTVKVKEDVGGVRLGRDGFENVENTFEKEMTRLSRQEEAAREVAKRRESMLSEGVAEADRSMDSPVVPQSPVVKTPLRQIQTPDSAFKPNLHRRSESLDVANTSASPTKHTFGMRSAWNEGNNEGDNVLHHISFEGDQTELDLSDIVPEDVEAIAVDEPALLEAGPSEIEQFMKKPVLWTGGIVNPAFRNPVLPPMEARLVSSGPLPPSTFWSTQIPEVNIAITGRVPTQLSHRFLAESRLNPGRDLVLFAFTLAPNATAEQREKWDEFMTFHKSRDRVCAYVPYEGRAPPPDAAKDIYLIPLIPSDPSPEFTDLVEGYSLPKSRTESILLGVFVLNRSVAAPPPTPLSTAPISTTLNPPMTHPLPVPTPDLQNAQLQALLVSAQAAIQATPTIGGRSPITGAAPPIAAQQPWVPPGSGYENRGYEAHQRFWPSQAANPPREYYEARSPYPPNHQEHQYDSRYGSSRYDSGRHDERPKRARSPDNRGRRDFDRSRDSGWGNRGGRLGSR